MAKSIQAKLDKIRNTRKACIIIEEFCKYANDNAELEKEYTRIPRWKHFTLMRNFRKRENLMRDFKSRMFNLGIFN